MNSQYSRILWHKKDIHKEETMMINLNKIKCHEISSTISGNIPS